MINNEETTEQMSKEELDAVASNEEAAPETNKKSSKLKRKKGSKDKQKIAELEQETGELKDKYLRLFAEFDNYKKRTVREKLDLMKTAARDTLSAMLDVLDDFDRARQNEEFSEGVSIVYNKLYAKLGAKGLKPMESNGEEFDPELHEALTEIPAPSEDMKGKVIDTIEKGYYLNETIIRHAKVVVGK